MSSHLFQFPRGLRKSGTLRRISEAQLYYPLLVLDGAHESSRLTPFGYYIRGHMLSQWKFHALRVSLCRCFIHKSLARRPARQLRASLGIMLPSLNNQRLHLIGLIYSDSRSPVMRSNFLSNSKIEKYVLLYAICTTNTASKSFPFEYSVLKLDFSILGIKSREFTKVCKALYFIFCLEQL